MRVLNRINSIDSMYSNNYQDKAGLHGTLLFAVPATMYSNNYQNKMPTHWRDKYYELRAFSSHRPTV